MLMFAYKSQIKNMVKVKNKQLFKRVLFCLAGLVLITAIVLFILEKTHVIDLYHKKPSHVSQTSDSTNSGSSQQCD
jgi:cytochrome c-type biogenesis protein CcmE